jgi:hypothetical protein
LTTRGALRMPAAPISPPMMTSALATPMPARNASSWRIASREIHAGDRV